MKKISMAEGILIIQEFFQDVKKSVNETSAQIMIEYFELVIEEKIFERWNCAYIQNETQTEAILYESTLEKVFYIKSELIKDSNSKFVPELFSLDYKASNQIPQKIIDKMRLVIQNRKNAKLSSEDFGTKFSLVKPKPSNK